MSFGVQTWLLLNMCSLSVTALSVDEASLVLSVAGSLFAIAVVAASSFWCTLGKLGRHPIAVQAAALPSLLQTHVLQSCLKVSFGVHWKSSEAAMQPWSTSRAQNMWMNEIQILIAETQKWSFFCKFKCMLLRLRRGVRERLMSSKFSCQNHEFNPLEVCHHPSAINPNGSGNCFICPNYRTLPHKTAPNTNWIYTFFVSCNDLRSHFTYIKSFLACLLLNIRTSTESEAFNTQRFWKCDSQRAVLFWLFVST